MLLNLVAVDAASYHIRVLISPGKPALPIIALALHINVVHAIAIVCHVACRS